MTGPPISNQLSEVQKETRPVSEFGFEIVRS